jgi:hypothetical protein
VELIFLLYSLSIVFEDDRNIKKPVIDADEEKRKKIFFLCETNKKC